MPAGMETPERTLVYIPIIHTLADMGGLGPSLERMKLAKLGPQGLAFHAGLVAEMWDQIERVANELPVIPGKVRVYQDGLPVCGHEQQIVSQLAEKGSRNHRLLLRLQAKGALLMGTESGKLLVEEYRLASAILASGGAGGHVRAEARRKASLDALLEKRDRYIAARINATLAAGETGILFLGMLHAVDRRLDPDVRVVYPIGPPRNQRGGAT